MIAGSVRAQELWMADILIPRKYKALSHTLTASSTLNSSCVNPAVFPGLLSSFLRGAAKMKNGSGQSH